MSEQTGLTGRALRPLKGQLSRKIALVVFATIVVVEVLILIPSVKNFERDHLASLAEAGRTAATAGVQVAGETVSINPGILKTGIVAGLAVFNANGGAAQVIGEPPVNIPAAFSEAPEGVYAGPDAALESRFEFLLTLDLGEGVPASPAVVRLDSSSIGREANSFILRIIGLVLFISLCVCGSTILVINAQVLGPLLTIRDSLSGARKDPEHASSYAIEDTGKFEVAEVAGAINELFDTVQQTYREEIGLLSTMIENTAGSALVYDASGKLVYANDSCIKICGATDFEDLKKEQGPRFSCPKTGDRIILTSFVKNDFNYEVELVRPDGTRVDVMMNAGLLKDEDGNPVRWHAMLHDISLLKQREAQLEAMVAEVELTRDQALAASLAKSTFLASMSHELRTPLNAIIGYSELVYDDAVELGQKEFLADLDRIRKAADHLLGLISSILDLSRIEAGKMEVTTETFDVKDEVNNALILIRPVAEKHGNSLTVHANGELGAMTSDKTKLGQVLINLLSNACKFSDGGAVTLEASRRASNGKDQLVFKVIDTGPGIDDAQMSTLFQPFAQINYNRPLNVGSTGLGLAITKSICEALGGRIEAKSVTGQGCTFKVTLPAECPSEKPVEKPLVPVY